MAGIQFLLRHHSFSKYSNIFQKTDISYVRVRVRGQEMLLFQKIYWMSDPFVPKWPTSVASFVIISN